MSSYWGQKLYRLAQILVVCILASVTVATTAKASEAISITQAWSRATPKGSPVAAGYLTIENREGLPDRLLEVHSNSAKRVEIHTTVIEHGIKANRKILETCADYSLEQGLTPRRMKLEEIFAACTMGQ